MAIIGAVATMRSNQALLPRQAGEQDRRAHRMGERMEGRRAFRQGDMAHEGVEVAAHNGAKSLDMAEPAVRDQPVGAALAAPVEGRDGKAARPQVAHHLEIFLDELRAAMEQADRAARLARQRRPARRAHGDAVGGADHLDDGAARAGIVGQIEESHGTLEDGVGRPRHPR